MSNYLDNLKKTELRPRKLKTEQKKELLLDQEVSPTDSSKDIEDKITKQKTFPVGGDKVPGVEEAESKGMGDIHGTIIDFFKQNPNATKDDIEKLADEIGIDDDEIKNHMLMMFSKAVQQGRITEAEHLNELFVQMGEINNMDSGTKKDMAILRLAIIAEYDAASLYEEMADVVSSKKIRTVLLDIAKEEKVHVGEFESLLQEIDPEHEKSQKEGESEVKKLS